MRDFDYNDATNFLDSFFRGTEHVVEIRALSNDRSSGARSLFGNDDDLARAHCTTWDKPGWGVFFGCCTRLRGRPTGSRADLAELVALWCDIDCYKHAREHAGGFSKEEVAHALKSSPIPPTVIVDSGGGLHAYWLLREPTDVRLPEAGHDAIKEEIDAVLKQLHGVFAGDPSVCEIARVMRLPGTHNTKTGEMRPVMLLEASGPRYELSDLQDTLDWLGPVLRTPMSRTIATTVSDPYVDFAKRFAFKRSVDVDQRLAAMTYGAADETAIHPTRCSVSSSLVAQGVDNEQIFDILLAATHRAAGLVGQNWNWKREEKLIWREIETAKAKYAPAAKLASTSSRGGAKRSSATVFQLRAGGAQPVDETDEEKRDPSPELAGYPLNDLGNAMRLIVSHGTALRYVVGIGWHVWDDRRYKIDPGLIDARKLAHETAREMLTQAFDIRAITEKKTKARDQIIKFAINSGNTTRIMGMLSQAEPHLAADADDLDKNPLLLNCLNGTVDLRTGEMRPHAQADLLTKLCGADYDPDAECPMWLRFLLEIFDGDTQLVAFMQRAIGYSLTGLTSEQVIFILHGSGSNGKSVLIETIAAVLEDYVNRSPAETWISKSNNSPTNDIAALAGARFVSVIETEHEKQLAEALVKQATGGDAMTARFHYKEFFTFIPKFKLWLATNHKPRIRGSDYAIWRRILLLPFTVTFVDANKLSDGQKVKDSELKNKLSAEFPGILAWMIRGCVAWQEGGLQPPSAVVHATESYQDSQDNVSGFIRDNCYLSRGLECAVKLLHAGYENWCSENDEEPVKLGAFGKNLDERGYPAGPRTNKMRPRKGIDLKEEFKVSAAHRLALAKADREGQQ